MSLESERNGSKEMRIWIDGCFDIMHFGHANAIRQTKELGGTLIVGVHSDEEILKHKGPTIMTLEERISAVNGCRWVDEIYPNAPYITDVSVLREKKCDLCVHGDDITTSADGGDCYALVKEAGLYKEVKRTLGISTTDIVSRILNIYSKDLTPSLSPLGAEEAPILCSTLPKDMSIFSDVLPESQANKFFQRGCPKESDSVVYVQGKFDIFNHEHIELLSRARSLGTYLIVGIYNDVHARSSIGGPSIMNTLERALCVMGCKYVDDVVLNAPSIISKEFLEIFPKIDIIAIPPAFEISVPEAYESLRKTGIVVDIPNLSRIRDGTRLIIERVLQRREMYEERETRKQQKDVIEKRLKKSQERGYSPSVRIG